MKFLLLLAVIGIALLLFKARQRGPAPKAPAPPRRSKPAAADAPTPMLACAHCGVHLPQTDAVNDAEGRPYCGAAHLAAGPR